eukprot:3105024-Prymnesium_polylepis.3
MLKDHMGSSGDHFGSSSVISNFTAARSAAAHGDDFTAILPTSHLHNSSPFATFPILIEDPEGNMMRSLQIRPCLSVPRKAMHRVINARKKRAVAAPSRAPPGAPASPPRIPLDHLGKY